MLRSEEMEDSNMQMIVMGLVATLLSPFFVFLYLVHMIFRCASMSVTVLSIIVMVVIGLPVLTVLRWIYSMYNIIYQLLMCFYLSAQTNARYARKVTSNLFQRQALR